MPISSKCMASGLTLKMEVAGREKMGCTRDQPPCAFLHTSASVQNVLRGAYLQFTEIGMLMTYACLKVETILRHTAAGEMSSHGAMGML